MRLKKANLIVLLAACLIGAVANIALFQTPEAAPAEPPVSGGITFTDFDDRSMTLRNVTTDTIVLHFWATWCPPCIKELPSLLERAGKEKDVTFILVSVDKDVEKALNFLTSYDYLFKDNAHIFMASDPYGTQTLRDFKIIQFPETIILNRDLTKRKHIKGAVAWENYRL